MWFDNGQSSTFTDGCTLKVHAAAGFYPDILLLSAARLQCNADQAAHKCSPNY